MRRKQTNNDPNYNVVAALDKVLDGMLFCGPLSLKLNRDLQQWIHLSVVIRMNLVCTAVFFIQVLICTAYTNLANTFLYKLSIEKQ